MLENCPSPHTLKFLSHSTASLHFVNFVFYLPPSAIITIFFFLFFLTVLGFVLKALALLGRPSGVGLEPLSSPIFHYFLMLCEGRG
jgi:hypothetical protein